MGCTPLFLNAEPREDRVDLVGDGGAPDGGLELGDGELLAVEEGLGDLVVDLGERLEQLLAVLGGLVGQVGRDLLDRRSPRPAVSPRQVSARIFTRSTTPMKSASAPIGSCRTSGVALSRSIIMSTQRKKLAPVRSSLLTKHIRGTLYLSACRQTFSVCGSTPATPSYTATAPSSTRSERSTSTVKSTWPGVSMMLIVWSFHVHFVAADVIVMPRSCSCSIQSMVAAPSWTSPIL